MTTEHLKLKSTIFLLTLLPTSAIAEGGLDGLKVFDLISDTYNSLLIIGIIAIVLALIYAGNGSKWFLYLSVVPAGFLFISYIYSFILFQADESLTNELLNPLRSDIFLLALTILLIISIKKFKDKPNRQFWYFLLNTSSILFAIGLTRFLPIPFPFGIVIYFFFPIFYTFLFLRSRIRAGHSEAKKLIMSTSLICFLSFLTVFIFDTLRVFHITYRNSSVQGLLVQTISLVFVSLVGGTAIATISTLLAIKKYR